MRYGLDLPATGPCANARTLAERAWRASVAEAGATWWAEYIPPDVIDLDEIRAHIERGPLRIE